MVSWTRDDWVAAALAELLAAGPEGVAVQPIARRLGATKGSFYWHFSSRDDLLRATLARWETTATDEVISTLEASTDEPYQKVQRLFATVTTSSERHPGQLLILTCTDQPDVAAAVQRTTERRIAYVAALLRAAGRTSAVARRRATLAYAAYLGHALLAASAPTVLPGTSRARRELVAEMAAILLA